METKDIRRKNLEMLLANYPSKRAFADEMDMNPAHVSQLANGYREMGHNIARRIEEKESLAKGYMDKLHTADKDEIHPQTRTTRSSELNKNAVKDSITVIKFIENKTSSTLSTDEWTELFSHFYQKYDDAFESGEEIDKAELMLDFHEMMANLKKQEKQPA